MRRSRIFLTEGIEQGNGKARRGNNVVEDEGLMDLTESIGQGNERAKRGKNVVGDEALEDLSH